MTRTPAQLDAIATTKVRIRDERAAIETCLANGLTTDLAVAERELAHYSAVLARMGVCPDCNGEMDIDRECLIEFPVLMTRRDQETHERRTKIARAALCTACECCIEISGK